MQKNLLLFFCFFLLSTLHALHGQSDGLLAAHIAPDQNTPKSVIKIYPNPATQHIGISDTEQVSKILIYNLVGQKVRKFSATKGGKYLIGDLPRGMYLVQLVNHSGKVLTTQRLSKR